MTTAQELDAHTRSALAGLAPVSVAPLDPAAEALFEAALASRHLDLAARWMQAQGRGFYTIGSAGHEGNAAVALALRVDDPALLHYRSGAFYCARAWQAASVDPLRDVLLGVAASAEEPIAGGRHKVFGRRELSVIPQTSTIASHLPRALGLAVGIGRATKLAVSCPWPRDAVVVCSFGDASLNHSTAVGALNAMAHTAFRGIPLPLLMVCEDNGLGISVPTPPGWVEAAMRDRPGVRYLCADGCDPVAALAVAREAVAFVRSHHQPVFLHLRTVRYLGHAGSDAEAGYRSAASMAAELARDPLVAIAQSLVSAGILTASSALERYDEMAARVRSVATSLLSAPPTRTRADIVAPLAPRRPEAVAAAVPGAGGGEALTLAQSVNRALAELMTAFPGMCVFGEDVGRKGGVYGVTKGLQKAFGPARVFDTLLDEQTILGVGLGGGLAGLLPVPEIQYLAYLHNAEDQLRGEAATQQFFSSGAYRNPMVVRVAGLGYQKGFGGHFHNDNSVAFLRDIPGLVVACPSRPDDAAALLRTCTAAAAVDGTVSVFLEPIALYHERDLHAAGDDGWLASYPASSSHAPVGVGRLHGSGSDLTIVTYGNGLRMSLRVAARLAGVRVFDLRWLAPLDVAGVLAAAHATGRVLVVDEGRRTGGVAEAVLAALVDGGFAGPVARVCSADSFVPLGPWASLVLLQEQEIEEAAHALLARARVV